MAHKEHITHIEDPGPISLSPGMKTGVIALAVAGAVIWVIGFLFHGALRFWESMLVAYMYFLMLGLGGVVFTAIQYMASARWSIAVRRIAEGMGSFIPVAFGLFLIIIVGGWGSLYDPESQSRAFRTTAVGLDPIHIGDHLKHIFVSFGAVIIKGIIFYGLWFFLAQKIRKNSLEQDRSKDPSLFKKNVTWSIAFMIVFAYTFSLHCVDMLMALEPKWFSTMFGVYSFSGMLLSSFCVITLLTIAMRRRHSVSELITKRHMYDLGTWIMAFSCFMMYIGFSQYMLIWYANLPEESFYMVQRTEGGWQYIFVILPFLKWVVPFAVLMPQGFRAHTRVQILVCIAVLVGQWLDLYWVIYPVFSNSPVVPGLTELGAFLMVLGLFGISLDRTYSKHSVLPIGDPYLKMSVSGSYL